MPSTLNLTRYQLASFLNNDQDLIRRFEELLIRVGVTIPNSLDEMLIVDAINESKINSLTADIQEILSLIDGSLLTPANNNGTLERILESLELLLLEPKNKELAQEDFIAPPNIINEQRNTSQFNVDISIKANSPFLKGQVLVIVGFDSDAMLVEPLDGANYTRDYMGVATEDMTTGQIGTARRIGVIDGLNFTGLAVGLEMFATVSSSLSPIQPAKPSAIIRVGYVMNNSQLYAMPHIVDPLEELTNVEFGTLTDDDLLTYNATDELWENQPHTML